MIRVRKIYDAALKLKAVEVSNEPFNSIELARELSIRVSKQYKWRKKYDKLGANSFNSTYWIMLAKYSTLTEEEKENKYILGEEKLEFAYDLNYHLKKRGIIIEI